MNKIIIISIILLLALCSIFLGAKYYFTEIQLQKVLSTSKVNDSILTFNKLFVDKVLGAKGEVSYADRLKLENAVVATKDNDMISSWHNFLNSKTEKEAQGSVMVLLKMFAEKILINK
ncbi:MAG: hypothetical protein NTY04_03845 [Candidatus Staskawiczbacteria bacterium]|nr:hypothetical protein [Candidatus Staskawiczbacteria bacterium]